jgi:hypothetical protein
MRIALAGLAVGALLFLSTSDAVASSHREAPFITKMPKVDNTDFYMFRSYEPGRDGFVTLIANFQPLQDSYGGPNYFSMDPEAIYEIHLDNSGDAVEDVTFQFQFSNALSGAGGSGIALAIGAEGAKKDINIPLLFANVNGGAAGGVTPFATTTPRHVNETYGIKVIRGNRRTGTAADITHTGGPGGNGAIFVKPLDYVGLKTFGEGTPGQNYDAYANQHIYGDVAVPGCATAGTRVFVGQRRESFAVNLGAIFDLINAPLDATGLLHPQGGSADLYAAGTRAVALKNVTTIAIEVPIACIKGAGDVVGGWASASVRQARVINPQATYERPSREGGAWAQVSRLGMPLVNEVVIGLKDKDRFNSSEPKDDAQYADYVTHPSLPAIVEAVFGSANAPAPTVFPRADLVTVFLDGIPGVNKFPGAPKLAEMLRLNVALPAIPVAQQFRGNVGGGGAGRGLGAAGCFVPDANTANPKVLDASAGNIVNGTTGTCDPAGFPNGRRPGDDVVDIALRVVMGYLLTSGSNPAAPAGDAPLGDGLAQVPTAGQFAATFPYLYFPNAGAGN